jgi:hypothetical protein
VRKLILDDENHTFRSEPRYRQRSLRLFSLDRMKARLMTSDWTVLAIVVAVLLLVLIDRGVWFDRCMGAILVFGGIYFFLLAAGALPRLRPKPTVIPYPVMGVFMIVQGLALGIFHVRF